MNLEWLPCDLLRHPHPHGEEGTDAGFEHPFVKRSFPGCTHLFWQVPLELSVCENGSSNVRCPLMHLRVGTALTNTKPPARRGVSKFQANGSVTSSLTWYSEVRWLNARDHPGIATWLCLPPSTSATIKYCSLM